MTLGSTTLWDRPAFRDNQHSVRNSQPNRHRYLGISGDGEDDADEGRDDQGRDDDLRNPNKLPKGHVPAVRNYRESRVLPHLLEDYNIRELATSLADRVEPSSRVGAFIEKQRPSGPTIDTRLQDEANVADSRLSNVNRHTPVQPAPSKFVESHDIKNTLSAWRDPPASTRRPYYGSESDEEDGKHVVSWIPAENVEVECLAGYLREFIDAKANIMPRASPKDKQRQGYLITAQYTLSYDQVQDIMSDSRSWIKERRMREYIREPYNYTESDTFEERIKRGGSLGGSSSSVRRRRG